MKESSATLREDEGEARGKPLRRTPAPRRPAFVRARGLVEEACDFDAAVASAVRAPHMAIDPFGRILGLSGEVAAWLGFPPSSIVGRRLVHRVVAAWRGPFQRALLEARAGIAFPSMPIALRTKTNDVLRVVLTPRASGRWNGQEVLVLGVARIGDAAARGDAIDDGDHDATDDAPEDGERPSGVMARPGEDRDGERCDEDATPRADDAARSS